MGLLRNLLEANDWEEEYISVAGVDWFRYPIEFDREYDRIHLYRTNRFEPYDDDEDGPREDDVKPDPQADLNRRIQAWMEDATRPFGIQAEFVYFAHADVRMIRKVLKVNLQGRRKQIRKFLFAMCDQSVPLFKDKFKSHIRQLGEP